MTVHDDDLVALADRIMACSTSAAVVHRIRVDDGDLTIVHVDGEEVATHILIVTNPENGDLVSISVYAFADEEMDNAYYTLETVNEAPYVYSGVGRDFVDAGEECVDRQATVIFAAPFFNKQEDADVA